MKAEDKKESIDYWDRYAETWKRFAIDPKEDFLDFPTSWQRGKIVEDEIMIQDKDKKSTILDLGCADGSLLISLIGNGYFNVKGVDNSMEMINEARKILKQKNNK